MLKKLILLSLILSILPMINAVEINDTLVINTITNYSFYVNNSIYLDQLSVTDAGRIEIYNITSNQTHIPILFNTNNTYISVIDFYGLNKALIEISNGSVGCPNVESCSGNINVTIPVNSYIKIYDNYNVETGTTPNEPRPNDPVSSGTSGTGTNQSTILNSSLSSPVIFSLIGLNNALIFNDTFNVLVSQNINDNDGTINLTIRGEEVIYILNNYEKSELYTRTYDPIWFSSSSNTEKHIASNLSDSVTISVYMNQSLPNRIYTYNESLVTYNSYGNESFNNNSGMIEINLTIYPGNNTISFDCIQPFNNINILENLSTCVNQSYSITNLYISNNSIFTINQANLTVDRIEKTSGKLIKNVGSRLIII